MKEIYTDGSCLQNPAGPGGYAAIVVDNKEVVEILAGYFPSTTNNRMEIMGIRAAIIYCIENEIQQCKIYSDSEYSVKGINEWMYSWRKHGWKGSKHSTIKNVELWIEIDALWRQATQKLNISIHWIKGHAKNKFNEIADHEAREIILKNYNGDNEQQIFNKDKV